MGMSQGAPSHGAAQASRRRAGSPGQPRCCKWNPAPSSSSSLPACGSVQVPESAWLELREQEDGQGPWSGERGCHSVDVCSWGCRHPWRPEGPRHSSAVTGPGSSPGRPRELPGPRRYHVVCTCLCLCPRPWISPQGHTWEPPGGEPD